MTLGLSFVGLYLYDVHQFNSTVQARLEKSRQYADEILAPVLAQNPLTTQLPLKRLLLADPQIASVAVYNAVDGKLLSYDFQPGFVDDMPTQLQVRLRLSTADATELQSPIHGPDGRTLGTLRLKASLTKADEERFANLLKGSTVVFLCSALLAIAVGYRLQLRISNPITELARAAATVRERRDYSIRVRHIATDEIGDLIVSFNSMLHTIQVRTAEIDQARIDAEQAREEIRQANSQLAEINRTLEARVEERTKLLAKAVQTAEEANRAKSDFLAKMSHELRTPLNAIIGYSEILAEDAADDGRKGDVEDLAKVISAARHLLGLINDVLDISKIEAGRMELYLENIDVARVVREVIATATPLVHKKGNQLVLDCPDDIGAMYADATKLRQMLLNLLSNASKFTEKGIVTLAVRRLPGRNLDQMEFAVRDTGIGMTPEQVGRLFQAFSQADASISSKYGGTGLGLAISKQFAQMMGGDIAVASIAGEGSTFTINVPVTVRAPKSKVVNRGAGLTQSPFSSKPKILVIDDDPETLKHLGALLESSGYKPTTATSGAQGLELAEAERPDLILLDVVMPGMDGWTVLSKLQSLPVLADIPVIVLSVLSDLELALSLGAAAILPKPLEAELLTAAVAEQLRPLPPRYILHVDDDASSREVFARLIEREHWPVHTAQSGHSALRVMRRALPAVIVLDLKMAGMNGFEFLDRIRNTAEWSKIPVVVLTALDFTQERRDFLAQRAVALFQKGRFTREELVATLRPIIDKPA